MFTDTIMMRFLNFCSTIFLLLLPSLINATSCVYPTPKEVEGLIQTGFEPIGDDESLLYLSVPEEYQALKFNDLTVVRSKDATGGDIYLSLATELENGQRTTDGILGTNSELDNWEIFVTYEEPRLDSDEYVHCIHQIRIKSKIKHNKTRNEMDGSVEPPIR
jgi:hypothetical protein